MHQEPSGEKGLLHYVATSQNILSHFHVKFVTIWIVQHAFLAKYFSSLPSFGTLVQFQWLEVCDHHFILFSSASYNVESNKYVPLVALDIRKCHNMSIEPLGFKFPSSEFLGRYKKLSQIDMTFAIIQDVKPKLICLVSIFHLTLSCFHLSPV